MGFSTSKIDNFSDSVRMIADKENVKNDISELNKWIEEMELSQSPKALTTQVADELAKLDNAKAVEMIFIEVRKAELGRPLDEVKISTDKVIDIMDAVKNDSNFLQNDSLNKVLTHVAMELSAIDIDAAKASEVDKLLVDTKAQIAGEGNELGLSGANKIAATAILKEVAKQLDESVVQQGGVPMESVKENFIQRG